MRIRSSNPQARNSSMVRTLTPRPHHLFRHAPHHDPLAWHRLLTVVGTADRPMRNPPSDRGNHTASPPASHPTLEPRPWNPAPPTRKTRGEPPPCWLTSLIGREAAAPDMASDAVALSAGTVMTDAGGRAENPTDAGFQPCLRGGPLAGVDLCQARRPPTYMISPVPADSAIADQEPYRGHLAGLPAYLAERSPKIYAGQGRYSRRQRVKYLSSKRNKSMQRGRGRTAR